MTESAINPMSGNVKTAMRFRASERRKTAAAVLLTLPLLVFLLVFFFAPLAGILIQSIRAPEVSTVLLRTTDALEGWHPTELPGDDAYRALIVDLRNAYADKTVVDAAVRLNHEIPGMRQLVLKTARRAKRLDDRTPRQALSATDRRWDDLKTWRAIAAAREPYTLRYLLSGLDLGATWDGTIKPVPPNQRVHVRLFIQTLWISCVVTMISLIAGYPVAFVMATTPGRWGGLLLALVLLPFWTSSLVRTAAWMVVLQNEGILNALLMGIGIIAEPLEMIYNRFGVYVAMVYVMLPFMVLPLYSVMKTIRPDQLKAAESLGATPLSAFGSVYLPQTIPGITAGCLLVFIQSLGFYVTPALMGGRQDQMISMVIANYAMNTANWNMAAALSLILLACVAALYPLFSRYVGSGRLNAH
jgi:putative spermidine/putrescine transport system permease protein